MMEMIWENEIKIITCLIITDLKRITDCLLQSYEYLTLKRDLIDQDKSKF